MTYECGFYAVNKKHCYINERCVVCRRRQITVHSPTKKIHVIIPDAKKGIYTPYTEAIKAGYRLITKEDIILYQPNSVSYRKKIISA